MSVYLAVLLFVLPVINLRWEKRSCSNTCLFGLIFVITSVGFLILFCYYYFICYTKVKQLQLFSYTKDRLHLLLVNYLLRNTLSGI